MADKLIIFDTTLRDGEQSPGASMTKDEKLRIARQLERLKVDVIEAGFAASSNGDFECVKAIAHAIKDSTVCSLARANDRDIARAAEALAGGSSTRIHLFLATSALHMEKKLRMTPDQVFEQARLSVRFARNLSGDVEFSPEDGYRSDPDFLCRVLDYHEHAIGSGADARAVAYLELRVGDAGAGGQTLFGVGIDTNIVSASLKAIVSGLSRPDHRKKTRTPDDRQADHFRHHPARR